jgi:hypothetical protein
MVDPIHNLSYRELQVFNFSSQEIDPNILLGNRFQDALQLILASEVEAGTPVNAVAATATLDIAGVVLDGEMFSIDDDIYEFCADAAQSLTYPGNIAVDISNHTAPSTGTMTMDTQPISGNTLTLGTKVYTFVPIGTDTADGEVSIGADLTEAQANLVAAINGRDGISLPHPLVYAGDFAADDCVITALVGGAAGDLIATTETFTAPTNIFVANNLGNGADCLAADAVTALVAAITAFDTVGVGAADGAGNTVVLTADVAGVAGSAIPVATNIANASFVNAVVRLAGGVDGTVAEGVKFMADDTWLYVCPSYNEVSGANWRRIALGNVF